MKNPFFDLSEDSVRGTAFVAAANAARTGELTVFPTDTVYGLGTDAFSIAGANRIRDAKGRGRDVPLPVLIAEPSLLSTLGLEVSDSARRLCEKFWPGGLTVIVRAAPSLGWDLGRTNGTVALRMPNHEFVLELLRNVGPMAVSSANTHGRPPATSAQEAYQMLGETVSVYVEGGPSPLGAPSTIVDVTGPIPAVVRVGVISIESIRSEVAETALRRASG